MTDPTSQYALAKVALDSKNYDEAIGYLKPLVTTDTSAQNVLLLIAAHLGKGEYQEVINAYEKHKISVPEISFNVATAYAKLGKTDEEYKILLVTLPQSGELEYYLKRTYDLACARKDARAIIFTAINLLRFHSSNHAMVFHIANSLASAGEKGLSLILHNGLQKALNLDPNISEAIDTALSGTYKDLGDMPTVMEKYVELNKKSANHLSNHIMSQQYAGGYGMGDFYRLNRIYNAKHTLRLPRYNHFARLQSAEPPKKVGVISGDFCCHSLTTLMKKVWEELAKLDVELHCYFTKPVENEDGASKEYASFMKWHNVNGLSDDKLAAKVHADGIDILIELAGHTAHNRLKTFGYCPAPVQVGWICGMMTPAGSESIPYFITDKYMPPEEIETAIPEILFKTDCMYTYFPREEVAVKEALPATANGFITFGAYNNPCKLNEEVVTAWAQIMQQVPNSRLKCKIYNRLTAEIYQPIFTKHGVHGNRIEWLATSFPSTAAMMQNYTDNIDIALDTWPCAGMLTSIEAMWMGVPIPTYAGDTFLSRQTWSVLNLIGLADLGSKTVSGYIDLTVQLATNRTRLEHLRKSLRSRIEESLIRNPAKVAKGIHESLLKAWEVQKTSRNQLQAVLGKTTLSKAG